MLIFLIILMGYLLPAIYNYRWTMVAFSEGGILAGEESDIIDVIFTFCPIANIGAMICNTFLSPYDYAYKKPKNYNKFFKIK